MKLQAGRNQRENIVELQQDRAREQGREANIKGDMAGAGGLVTPDALLQSGIDPNAFRSGTNPGPKFRPAPRSQRTQIELGAHAPEFPAAPDSITKNRGGSDGQNIESDLRRWRDIAEVIARWGHLFSFWISSGTAWWRSATSPKSATPKIGAFASLLIAAIKCASLIPARC